MLEEIIEGIRENWVGDRQESYCLYPSCMLITKYYPLDRGERIYRRLREMLGRMSAYTDERFRTDSPLEVPMHLRPFPSRKAAVAVRKKVRSLLSRI